MVQVLLLLPSPMAQFAVRTGWNVGLEFDLYRQPSKNKQRRFLARGERKVAHRVCGVCVCLHRVVDIPFTIPTRFGPILALFPSPHMGAIHLLKKDDAAICNLTD